MDIHIMTDGDRKSPVVYHINSMQQEDFDAICRALHNSSPDDRWAQNLFERLNKMRLAR